MKYLTQVSFVGLFFVFFPFCSCYIDNYHHKLHQPSARRVRNRFGLSKGGRIDFQYEIHDDTTRLLLLIIDDSQYDGWYRSPLSSHDVMTICSLPSMSRHVIVGNGSVTYQVKSTDKYTILLALCNEIPHHTHIEGRLEMANPTLQDDDWNYLPIEQVQSLRIYLGAFLGYICLLLIIISQFHLSKREEIKGVHYAFIINAIIATISSSISYAALSYLNESGESGATLSFFDSFFASIRSTVFYFTILILSLGWTVTKETVSVQEYQVVVSFFLFYLSLGIAGSVCFSLADDTSHCDAIPLFLYILRGIVIISSIIAMNYTVSHLRTLITNLTWCPSLPFLYHRLRNYYHFRALFLLYILLPTVCLMIQVTLLSWHEEWIMTAFNVAIGLAFYYCAGLIFSPLDLQELVRPFDGSLISEE